MKTYDYNGTKVYLQKEEYRNNGTLAVLMYKEDGELYGCITVNLNHPLQSDTLAFLDENNMPGIGKWLRKKKLAAPHPSPRLQFQRTVKAFCCKRGKEIGGIGPKCCRVYTCTASIGRFCVNAEK